MADKIREKTLSDFINLLGLTEQQVEFINSYSRIRAAKRFEREALRLVGSPELIKDWIYEGYKDTGFHGGGKCSRGHRLRYVHFAKNVKTKETVNFGSTCVADFFDLDPMILKLVQQGVMETNFMILQSLKKLEQYKGFNGYIQHTDIAFKLEQVRTILSSETKGDLVELMKIGEMDSFLQEKLPLPDQYEYRINRAYARHFNTKNHEFLRKNPQYVNLVGCAKELVIDTIFKNNHNNIWTKINDIVKFLNERDFLSPSQISILTKMSSTNYQEMDEVLDDLALIPTTEFNSWEAKIIDDISKGYKDWGCSDKQTAVLKKIHKQYGSKIEQIKIEAIAI